MEYPDGATPLDPDELQGLKFKHIQTREELDQMEQVNIQSGLMWLDRQKSPDVLNSGKLVDDEKHGLNLSIHTLQRHGTLECSKMSYHARAWELLING